MRKRLVRVIIFALLIGMAGLVYGIFVEYTGLAIPCMFHEVTGLYCPGCSVTGMCLALLHLDFAEAFACNPVILVLLPPLAAVFITGMAEYVRDGRWRTKRWQNGILYIGIAALCIFCVVRNLVF